MEMAQGSESGVAGPSGHFFFGNMAEFMVGRLSFLERMAREHGDVVRYRLGCDWTYLINDAEMARKLLADWEHIDNALTNGWLYLDQSYLAIHGRARAKPRSVVHGAVCPRTLFTQLPAMARCVERRLERFCIGETRDVLTDMLNASVDMIAQALAGRDADEWLSPVRPYLTDLQVLGGAYTASEDVQQRLDVSRRLEVFVTLEDVAERLVESIPADRSNCAPALAALLEAHDSGAFSRKALVHEICVLLLSNATPAVAAASTFYLLSHHPEARERLEAELDRTIGTRTPSAQELLQLPYLDLVVKEVMRLFPPVGLVTREVVQEWQCGELRMPVGSLIHISPYLLHRHPRYWDEPRAFVPERFDPAYENYRPQLPGAYIPFGSGIRRCIGDQLALLEIKLMVAMTVQRFRLRASCGYVPNYDVSPFGANFPQSVDMPMVIEARHDASPLANAATCPRVNAAP